MVTDGMGWRYEGMILDGTEAFGLLEGITTMICRIGMDDKIIQVLECSNHRNPFIISI